MKKYYIFILIALTACSKDDPEPVYTDVIGSWSFETADIAGKFSIVKSETSNIYGNLYMDNVNGTFTINGITKAIGFKSQIYIVGFSVKQLILREQENGGDFIEFYESGDLSSDYKTMTFDEYRIKVGTSSYQIIPLSPPLVMKRTK